MNTSRSIRAAISAGLLASLLVSLTGCVVAPEAPVPKTTITAKVPVMTALAETKEAQEKGGVEIAVVPSTYKAVRRAKYSFHQASPGFGAMLGASVATGGNSQQLIYIEETITPFLEIQPGRLQFTVRVNNKLARVFRGQGAVVQMNVAGKLVPFGQTDYKEILDGIVPPRNENTFTIYGPAFDVLPDKGTIGILLYDVVTATDVAGNVTEKQNFEWYFDYSTTSTQAQSTVLHGARYLDATEYQKVVLRAQAPSEDDPGAK